MDKVLVLAAHADDGEFGAGGTIARFIEEKKEVYYAVFSICEDSVPKHLPRDILIREAKSASKVLGILPERLKLFRFKVREFPSFRQKILDEMIELRNDIKPDMILLPSINDLHQDHRVVALEGIRAFKELKILSYEIPWNNLSFNVTCAIHLEEKHINKKIRALSCYKSQYRRRYAKAEYFMSLAKSRGIQVGAKYAEVFEVLRWAL